MKKNTPMTAAFNIPRYRVYLLRALIVDEDDGGSNVTSARLILEDTETGDRRAFDRPSALSAFLDAQRPPAAGDAETEASS